MYVRNQREEPKMKAKKLLLPLLMIGALSAQAVKFEAVPINHVYSPKGYNSNDDVEIVVEGVLPNLCYKNVKSEVSIKGKDVVIDIKAQKNSDPNIACAEMVIPFLKGAKVGLLDKGWYRVMINGEQRSDLYVEEFDSNGLEDEILANVEVVEVEEGSRIIKLKGQNASDCLVHDRIDVKSNKKDAYSIKPQMVQVSDFCPMKMVPFELEMEVPEEIERDKVLLHVRSLEGKSINKLFKNQL